MTAYRYAILDGEGYWFQHFLEGEVFFASPQETARQYDTVAAAIIDRDALAQLLMDDSLSIRQVAPIEPVVVTRGEGGKFISRRIQQDQMVASEPTKHPADGLGEIFKMDEFNLSIRQ